MDEFDSLPCNMFGYRPGWTSITQMEMWLRELERMIPDMNARNLWIRANCSKIREEFSPAARRSTRMFFMKIEAFEELNNFKHTRPHLLRGANLTPWSMPDLLLYSQ